MRLSWRGRFPIPRQKFISACLLNKSNCVLQVNLDCFVIDVSFIHFTVDEEIPLTIDVQNREQTSRTEYIVKGKIYVPDKVTNILIISGTCIQSSTESIKRY